MLCVSRTRACFLLWRRAVLEEWFVPIVSEKQHSRCFLFQKNPKETTEKEEAVLKHTGSWDTESLLEEEQEAPFLGRVRRVLLKHTVSSSWGAVTCRSGVRFSPQEPLGVLGILQETLLLLLVLVFFFFWNTEEPFLWCCSKQTVCFRTALVFKKLLEEPQEPLCQNEPFFGQTWRSGVRCFAALALFFK